MKKEQKIKQQISETSEKFVNDAFTQYIECVVNEYAGYMNKIETRLLYSKIAKHATNLANS